MYLPALPEVGRDLGASDPALQLSLSLCMIGMGIGQVAGGPISDRVGRRLPLAGGIVLFIIAVVATGLAPTPHVMLVARLLTGIGGGVGVVIARSMVRDLYSGVALARAFAVVGMVFGVAPVVAPLLGSGVLLVTSWRGIFVLIGAAAVALLVAGWRLGETLPSERRLSGGPAETVQLFASVLRDRTFLGPVVLLALAMVPMNFYLSMSSLVLQNHYGIGPSTFAAVFATNAIGIVVAGRVSMSIVHRVGERRILLSSLLAMVGACVVMVIGLLTFDSVWTMLFGLLVMVTATGFIMPNAMALAMASQGENAGTASSLLGLIQMTVGGVIPPVVTSILGVTPTVFAVSLLVAASVSLVPLLLLRRPADAR